jgi:predicted Zn-dependent peptidase
MTVKEPEVFKLSNGLRVAYLFDDALVAHLGVTIRAGSRYENPGEEGLAHFLEHCIFKGTKKRKAFHILSRLDSVGGELNAYTTKEEICVYGSFTTNHLNRATELLHDIVFHSIFPEKEIEREKEVVLDEINSYLDAPSDRIFDDFDALMFANDSLGNNILGTIESVRSFGRKELLSYIDRYFHPNNMVLSFVGGVSKNQVQKILEKHFGSIQKEGISPTATPFAFGERFIHHRKEANYQAHLVMGGPAPGIEDDKRRVMTLLINMLGGPALNSRLTLSIREKYGYAYNIEANYTPFEGTGYWSIYAGTDVKYLKKTIQLIHKELDRFIEKELTENQLNKAKTQLKGHIALGMDSNSGLMLNFAKSLLFFNQIDSLVEIHRIIDQITIDEIQAIARKYLNKENRSLLVFKPSTEN